jgi:hypothetical protein
MVLDDTNFHWMECNNIPASYVECPFILSDKGDPDLADPCIMVAGVVGTLVSCSGDGPDLTMNTVRPVTAWWMYVKSEVSRYRNINAFPL